ncbi:MAG: mandelate racemase/muconate lactonizing enzyme family protein [Acidobacteriota bacterium]
MEVIPVTFRLAEGYRIAGARFDRAHNIILKVDTSDGRTGFGCASPAPEVTGETPESSLGVLDDVLVPLLRESDAGDPDAVARRAREAAPGAPAARAAADMALHDLLGKRARLPLARLLGTRRTRLPTSVTLGIADDVATSLEGARRRLDAGFRILKVKIGEDWRADAETVLALRQALGPQVVIRVDANQGYGEDEARRFLSAAAAVGLELLEQPTPAADLDALRRLARGSPVPVMADEAVRSADDARRIVDARAVPLVNIKLMKSGGLGEAAEIAGITGSAGIGAMIGCNDESRIGIAAALHFALSAANVERADLDGHLDLVDDVARGGVRIEDGYVLPASDAPGLGVSVSLL